MLLYISTRFSFLKLLKALYIIKVHEFLNLTFHDIFSDTVLQTTYGKAIILYLLYTIFVRGMHVFDKILQTLNLEPNQTDLYLKPL